jgi:3-dehydroquinate synthase
MKKMSLHFVDQTSEIWIGRALAEYLGELSLGRKPTRAFIVADSQLKKQANRFARALKQKGWGVEVRLVCASESLKSLRSLDPLYTWLLQKGADRSSVIFAIGGGTVGDSVGFLAGTFLRGISWVSVPTTLIAQVDSGLGGKTGVNHRLGKNLIGVFHQPSAVLCDLDFLDSLPTRELVSGWGEVLKYALALDRPLFRTLKASAPGVLSVDLESVVERCLKWKKKLVQQDPLDRLGVRALLNFGHTFGHVFEAETDYRYFRHGEAVIWGMRAAAYLSQLEGSLSPADWSQVDAVLARYPVPPLLTSVSATSRLARLRHDKKTIQNQVNFVLLKGIGEAAAGQQVSSIQIRKTLRWLESQAGRAL